MLHKEAFQAVDIVSIARPVTKWVIQVKEAAQRALTDDWETALSYGVGIGHPGLCKWIAERHGDVDPAQVMVTNGSLEAGAMLFGHLVKPGTRVAVEQPTYDRTLLLLRQLGAELVPVPLEADGLDVGALEAALADGPIEFVHVIPNAHNPAGYLSLLFLFQAPAILAFALRRGELTAEAAFDLSRLDETFQEERWGVDAEAAARADAMAREAVTLERWFRALSGR